MMDDIDFERIEQDDGDIDYEYQDDNVFININGVDARAYADKIQFALALAQKLQSGEVSERMLGDMGLKSSNPKGIRELYANQWKAMTRALIEETQNELQRSDKGVGV